MLSDQVTQLLTAFVDGELSQRQRKAVMRLLHKSSEARALLRELQENAHKLKQLPRHKVEPSLVESIMQAITEHQAQPKPAAPRVSRRRRWLPYVAATLAASLLIGAIGLAYWKAMNPPAPAKGDTEIAKNETPEKKPEAPVPPTPPQRKPNPMLGPLVDGTFGSFAKPIPVDPPLVVAFRDLENGKQSGQFEHQVDRDKMVNLDITVKSNPKALARLREVLKDHNINVVVDPGAAKPADDKKAEYLVYADNLTSDELTKMMAQLGETIVVGTKNTQVKVPSPYQKVTVTPIAKDDRQKLAKLLGVEPALLERQDPKPNPNVKRQAVVLPANSAAPSKEVSQFANQLRASTPGAVRVLIKIRQE